MLTKRVCAFASLQAALLRLCLSLSAARQLHVSACACLSETLHEELVACPSHSMLPQLIADIARRHALLHGQSLAPFVAELTLHTKELSVWCPGCVSQFCLQTHQLQALTCHVA